MNQTGKSKKGQIFSKLINIDSKLKEFIKKEKIQTINRTNNKNNIANKKQGKRTKEVPK